MILWRISRHRDLIGTGGLKAAGRWHHAGQPVVYLSENPASSLLEVCVHTAGNDIPPSFTLLRIEGPDLKTPAIADAELPGDWQSQIEVTRKLGTDWLRKSEGVLLQVPSAIIPWTSNYLFNPGHPQAKDFRITETITYPFDTRIKR